MQVTPLGSKLNNPIATLLSLIISVGVGIELIPDQSALATTSPRLQISDCQEQLIDGVNLKALATAIATLESRSSGTYQAVGKYTCSDGGKNCGRGLGKYQFMNYNEYAVRQISTQLGGQEFLNAIERGYHPSESELLSYFPPQAQETAFAQSIAHKVNRTATEIDPLTGTPFIGDRLIERIAQKHFGGDYSQTDSRASDLFGQHSIQDYGIAIKNAYYEAGGGTCTLTLTQTHHQATSQTQHPWFLIAGIPLLLIVTRSQLRRIRRRKRANGRYRLKTRTPISPSPRRSTYRKP